jgi:hypothetical protein
MAIAQTFQTVRKLLALTVAKAESFQVPAIPAEVGPKAAKRFFESLPSQSETRTPGSRIIMRLASS